MFNNKAEKKLINGIDKEYFEDFLQSNLYEIVFKKLSSESPEWLAKFVCEPIQDALIEVLNNEKNKQLFAEITRECIQNYLKYYSFEESLERFVKNNLEINVSVKNKKE